MRRVGSVLIIAALCLACVAAGWQIHQGNARHDLVGPEFPGYAAPAATPTALWVGDSYTAGTGAASPGDGEACLTSALLHWTCALDAQGGTGYIADGHLNSAAYSPALGRLQGDAKKTPSPSVIVLDIGRNDHELPLPTVKGAVDTYLKKLAQDYPGVPVIGVVPYYMTSASNAYERAVAGWYDGKVSAVVDPIDQGWISPTLTGSMTIADHIHPTPDGHSYIAQHLAASIKALDLDLG